MSNRPEPTDWSRAAPHGLGTDWRSTLAGFVDNTDSHLKALRKDSQQSPTPFPSTSSRVRGPLKYPGPEPGRDSWTPGKQTTPRHPETVANARAELSSLLAAVQGSLADLRVEVAAAKRLSTNASAAVAGDTSPAPKAPQARSASVQPRPREQRHTADITPSVQTRLAAAAPPYVLGQPFGPLFSPSGPDALAVTPHALIVAGTPPGSGASSVLTQNEEVVKAIDQRLLELGHKIERSLERSMEEQSLRAQLQQALQAATVIQQQQQQQQQLALRSSAPAPVFAGAFTGPVSASGPSGASAPTGHESMAIVTSNGVGEPGAGGTGSTSASSASPLVILAMNKADAAEKLSSEIRSEVALLQKQAAKDSEDTEKRLTSLQDSSRQHWEKLCQVSTHVDSLLAQRSGTTELQAEVSRIAAKLVQLEAGQDRSVSSFDEQQRLIRQLSMTLQKLTTETEAEHAIGASRHAELAAKLEASAVRSGELELRLTRMGDVEARMARVGDLELKLARLGELEGRVARIADVEARVARLPDVEARVARLGDLEVKVARMGDVDAKMSRLGDIESKLARLGDVETRLSRLSDLEARVSRMGDVDARMGRLGDVEARLARLADVEAKLARLSDVEARLARMGDVEARLSRLNEMEAKMARYGEVEAKVARMAELESRVARLADAAEGRLSRLENVEGQLGRLGDTEARMSQLGALEARVSTLQDSVAKATAAAANNAATTASRSIPLPLAAAPASEPDPSVQEALRRLAALEQQVARLAAADPSSQVQERDRRRGPQLALQTQPSVASARSNDGMAGLVPSWPGEASPSPLSSARGNGTAGTSKQQGTLDRSWTPKELEERIKTLEDTLLQGSVFGSPGPNARSMMQALNARMERLEQIVRSDSSIESMAQEARLAVAEEFVLELRRDFHDVVGPTLEKLAAHVSELRKGQGQPIAQGSPERWVSEVRSLTSRLDMLATEVASLAQASALSAPDVDAAVGTRAFNAGGDAAAAAAATQERLMVLELQVKELSSAVEDNNSIFGRLQRHQALLDKVQHELESLRGSVTKEMADLKARLVASEEAVGDVRVDVNEARGQLAALAQLDEQLQDVSAAVQELSERMGVHEGKVAELEEQRQALQEEVASAASAAAEALAATASGAASAAGAGAAVMSRGLGALPPLQSQAASNARSFASDDYADKAALEELATDLRAKLADLRGSLGDVRKELGSKVQVLDAQIHELLAFREEILTSYVELQDGVERASNTAEDALAKASQQEEALQELSRKVELQTADVAAAAEAAAEAKAQSSSIQRSTDREAAAAASDAASLEGVQQKLAVLEDVRVKLSAIDDMHGNLRGLQQRVNDGATEQQERLEALDAKVHALSELLTAASQDSQAASEARTRAEELAYELSQAQEALDSLAQDSGRLAEQLALVAASGEETAGRLGRVADGVAGHDGALEKLQEGLRQLEDRVAALPTSMPRSALGTPMRTSLAMSEVELEGAPAVGTANSTPRMGMGLPATRSGVPASQAILNPLFSCSTSEDGMHGSTPASGASVRGPMQPSGQQAPSSPVADPLGLGMRLKPLEPTPPPLSEESSVRDKALFYEQLASRNTTESGAQATRRTLGGVDGPSRETSSYMASPRSTAGGTLFSDQAGAELTSPTAAAAMPARAVGVAALRQAAQAAGGDRKRLDAPAAAAPAPEPSIPAGPLAAVRAARSGLGLSGDMSTPDVGEEQAEDADSPRGKETPSVFGRESTFRRGTADEEHSVSSGNEEAEGPEADAEKPGTFGREQTFRRGAADEEVSVSSGTSSSSSSSSDDEEEDKESAKEGQTKQPTWQANDAFVASGVASDDETQDAGTSKLGQSQGLDAGASRAERDEPFRQADPGQEASGDVGSGFDDDDDDLELAGLAPPPAARQAAGEPEERSVAPSAAPSAVATPEAPDAMQPRAPAVEAASEPAAGSAPTSRPSASEPVKRGSNDGSGSEDYSSESGDIDEDIELEPGINPSGFDYDDEDDVWPGAAPAAQSTQPPAAPAAAAVAAKAPGQAAKAAEEAPPAASIPDPVAKATEAATAVAGSASATAAAPAAAQPAEPGPAAPADGASSLSTSSAVPPAPLAPLQLSGSAAAVLSMSGDLLGRRKLPPLAPLGALPATAGAAVAALGPLPTSASRGLDLTPPLLRPSLGQLSGNMSGNLSGNLSGELQGLAPPRPSLGGVSASSAAAGESRRSLAVAPMAQPPAVPPAEEKEPAASPATSLAVSGELPARKLLAPLAPLAPLQQRAATTGYLAPVAPPPGAAAGPSDSAGGAAPEGTVSKAPQPAGGSAPGNAAGKLAPTGHDVDDDGESSVDSGFSGMSIGDLHNLGPSAKRGEAVAESAADPVSAELLAPAPLVLPGHPALTPSPGPSGTSGRSPGLESSPLSPLRSLLMAQPIEQPYPMDHAAHVDELPRPAEPLTDADTVSGSGHPSEHVTGEVANESRSPSSTGLSTEASSNYSHDPSRPCKLGAGGLPPLQSSGKERLAALLEGGSGSGSDSRQASSAEVVPIGQAQGGSALLDSTELPPQVQGDLEGEGSEDFFEEESVHSSRSEEGPLTSERERLESPSSRTGGLRELHLPREAHGADADGDAQSPASARGDETPSTSAGASPSGPGAKRDRSQFRRPGASAAASPSASPSGTSQPPPPPGDSATTQSGGPTRRRNDLFADTAMSSSPALAGPGPSPRTPTSPFMQAYSPRPEAAPAPAPYLGESGYTDSRSFAVDLPDDLGVSGQDAFLATDSLNSPQGPMPSRPGAFGDDLGNTSDLSAATSITAGPTSVASGARPGGRSRLPPLPPGMRTTGPAASSTSALPAPPAAGPSQRSLLSSEDSLALIAPPDGAGASLLDDEPEDEDIFADSADREALGGLSLEASRSEALLASGVSGRALSTAPVPPEPLQPGRGLDSFASSASLDFNPDVSMEAERVVAMLSATVSQQSMDIGAMSAAAAERVQGAAAALANRISGASVPEEDPRGAAARGRSAGAAPSVAEESRVQGSLDFYDEDEDSASSSGSGDDRSTAGETAAHAAAAGAAAAGPSAKSGLNGASASYSDDSSMELEVFRPPPAPQPAAQPQQSPARGGGSMFLNAYAPPQPHGRLPSLNTGASSSAAAQPDPRQKQEREAVPATPFAHSLGDMSTSSGAYRVQVMTGSRTGAGCSEGAVRLTLYGNQGTHVAQLRSPGPASGAGDLFAAGSVDDFMVEAGNDIGDLSAIYIWHQGEGFSASWYVESVTVEQLMTGLEWCFDVHDWVRGGQRGGRVVRLPGARLSISRENSLTRLAGSQPSSPRGSTAGAGKAPAGSGGGASAAGGQAPQPAGPASGGGAPQRRGMAAIGDESLDVSSDMPSPVDGSGGGYAPSFGGSRSGGGAGGLPPPAPGRQQAGQEASSSQVGGERSAGGMTQSGSVHFSDDDDDGEDLLPGMGGRASTSASAFAGATSAATAASRGAPAPRVATNVPTGLGIVLDEDIEEVDSMLSTSAAFGLGPVSSAKGLGPALVSPRPPLPPGAPRRLDPLDGQGDSGGDAAFGGKRQQPLPPTPPANRRSGVARKLSNLEPESSLDSFGSGGPLGSRRRVRISGGGDDGDLQSELSVEGSELSVGSAASLSMYAPLGVRPPPLAGAVGVDYLGTSRKRVSWAEYAEELEFLRDNSNSSGSVASMTEEELLEAQGQTNRPDSSRVGYDDLIPNAAGSRAAAASSRGGMGAGAASTSAAGDGAGFTEVPLKQRRGQHANAYAYKIKVFTADKLNAGLGKTTVNVELLGREATVAQALPRGKGSFQRGCVDRFTLYSHAGDMGQLLALKVWHEGKTIGPGNWGFEQLVIDDRLKGNRYVFRNPDPECVLRKGRRHCLVLKPEVSRIDESEDLAEVAREYETQLAANRDLNEVDRAGLRGKLDKINQRLSKLGSKFVRSMSGSFGRK